MARLYPMQSMELDDEEQLDYPCPIPVKDRPQYPWGLKICLTQDEFEKLDIDPRDAVVGGIVHGHFLACITSVSSSDSDTGATSRVEMQIENLAIESEDEENAEADRG